jgi:alpha-L-rhamnosidase
MPGYQDSGWQPAKVVSPPQGQLVSQQLPPIRATMKISPVKMTEPLPGVFVYDLGINIAGWVRFRIHAEKGDTIILFHNEQLKPDGTVLCGPHSWWTYGPYQTDKFISGGKDAEIYEPHFTYHGFRYIQVNGMKKKPLLTDLEGIMVHTDPDQAGEFSCSNPDINKVQELIIRTQLNNLHSIPTDCPHREKIGWMGDGLVTTEEAIYNFDMASFYIKWYQDMLDAQEPDGHVPPIVPNPGWIEATSAKNPEGVIPVFSDPWWGGNMLMTPWKIYQYYGDKRYLDGGYDAMGKYLDWIGTRAKDYIFPANLGDWIEPAMLSGGKITPKEQIGTSAYFFFARFMSQLAASLNKTGDAEKYQMLANTIRKKYNERFFDDVSGLYEGGSMLSQAMPLYFKMVPEGKEKLVEDNLVDIITKKYNNHLSTGFVGTPLLFSLLSELDYAGLAYEMATQPDHPGWFYMLRNGATTIWEVWDAMAQVDHSRDHPAFGSIGSWYYQSLAGIQPDPESPGFRKIIIKPEVVGDLTWVKGSYNSIHGEIMSSWKKDGTKFTLDISIPVNTTARVYIPADGPDLITEGDKAISQVPQIHFLGNYKGRYIYEVGSGNYHFASELTKR